MLILLDIDGVMVPANSWKRPEFLADGFPAFSPKATQALQWLIAEANATVLLTTSHKANYTTAEWKQIFERRGIKTDRIISLPKHQPNESRKDEILNWFAAAGNEAENFVIIDDDRSLNDLPAFLKGKLVQTSPMIGLTDDLATEALNVLNKQKAVA